MHIHVNITCEMGYLCAGCKYTVHGRCANKNPAPCTRTYVMSKKETGVCPCLHDNIYIEIGVYLVSECFHVDVKTFIPHFRFQCTNGWVGTVTRRSVINARRRSRASKAWRANTVCGATRWWESVMVCRWFTVMNSYTVNEQRRGNVHFGYQALLLKWHNYRSCTHNALVAKFSQGRLFQPPFNLLL